MSRPTEKLRLFLAPGARRERIHSAPPKLPVLVMFFYWSLVVHLVLYFVLDELRDDISPGKHTTLNLRLVHKVAQPPAMIPDLLADKLQDLESSLHSWSSGSQIGLQPPVSGVSTWAPVADTNYYYQANELDTQPIPVEPVEPVYPDQGVVQNIAGHAVLQLLIDETGKVEEVDVLESSPLAAFGDTAREAFRAATFKPGQKGLLPVKSRILIRVDFEVGPEAG